MTPSLPQYTVGKILGIWALAAVPMGLLGWLVNPAVAAPIDGATGIAGSARIMLMLLGLVWQFVLVVVLMRHEAGRLSWSDLRERLWLVTPRRPDSSEPDRRLWLWVIPGITFFVLSVALVAPRLDDVWVRAFPFFAEPPEFSLGQLLAPEHARALAGAWWLYGLFLLLALFNTVLGEELLFRGVLLPRMAGAFGRWDWVANGVLFGVYHVHQPWGMASSILDGTLLFALPSRRFRSAWMGIAVHSAQSVYFALALLPAFMGKG